MVFSSLLFVFAFLAISLIAYFFASTIKQKNVVLLLFSLVFYSWGGPKYLVLLIGLSFWSWFTACRIADVRTKRGKKVWMFLECFGALLTLGFFKYRSEEHTSELQSRFDIVCRLLLEKKNKL